MEILLVLTGLVILASITVVWCFKLRGFEMHAPRIAWALVVGFVLLFYGLML